MAIHEIKDGETVLARHVTAEEWDAGLKFFSADPDYIQVGIWGYDKGKELLAHTHNSVPRTFDITQETLYIRKGKIMAHIYDKSLKLVDEREVCEGDIITLMFGGHGYTILEDGTQVLEVKNGPYVGAEADRVRL
ncbi:MAG: hypothetical protein COA43_13495 [Robiginitomaculum sp.]|nr:MAG: hypothetical protein COA43_13495 [Robiginitomaculum sp.]